MDLKQILNNALDILKYDGDIADTLAEMQRNWGKQLPVLFSPRLDAIVLQYSTLQHEQGVEALGQELSACGWALYDLDGGDAYLFALLPQAERAEFEAACRRAGQYCRLMQQSGLTWGQPAKARASVPLMPCEEYVLTDDFNYYFNSLAGDFAAGQWKLKSSENWQNGCIADLRCRPPQITRAKSLPQLGNICYSSELGIYGASRSAGNNRGRVLVGKNPANLNWFEPSPVDYDGPPRSLFWCGRSLWAGDPLNATRIELTVKGTRKDVQNWRLPKDGWSGSYHCGITADGLGRVYFSNEWYKGAIYKWENEQVSQHHFSLSGYDHLSEAVPVPGTSHIYIIHAVSGRGRIEEHLLDLDMDTGRCRIASLPHMGEDLKLRWFTEDRLLIQGTGETASYDFAQLINMKTREVLRIRFGMFGSEKMQHIGILTDGTIVIITRRHKVGPVFRYPTDFWNFLRTASKPQRLERWREYAEIYPDIPFSLPPLTPSTKIADADNSAQNKTQEEQKMTDAKWLAKYAAVKHKLACKINLEAYFTEPQIGNMPVDILEIGKVNLPTGRLFACDPLIELEDAQPFLQTVPAGSYPVKICVVPSPQYGDRYACVKLVISDAQPVRYELAMTGTENLDEELSEGDYFGFGVDAGMACIADCQTQQAYQKYWRQRCAEDEDIDPYNDLFCDILAASCKNQPRYQRDGGDWANWTVPGMDLNIPIFASGWGDGLYPCYFAYDANDNVCGVYLHFIDIAADYAE